ncbi:MAG: pirin family protein [bacterium]|nr:pirin family protein [bacterium]
MLHIRKSAERGVTDLGWLHSQHTFSFGRYHDSRHMGISALRVINDDHVQPGAGFATHGHQDMEILTYVTDGAIEHKDSMGHIKRLLAGEFQLMTAGTGVTHSEYNASDMDPLRFLQIWIVPSQRRLTPGYQQKRFTPTTGMQLIASPDGREGSLLLHQDASLCQVILEAEQHTSYDLAPGRILYLHLLHGALTVCGETLQAGDGIALTPENAVHLHGATDTEALLFDLPETPCA